MTGTSPPACENCKPGKATDEREAALDKLDCQATYDVVAACMEAHHGNITDCRNEWNEFGACHKEQQRISKGSSTGAQTEI
ncbi:unnamed protein product [Hapterophycus canaliculatus]